MEVTIVDGSDANSHEEYIEDSFYTDYWTIISTPGLCVTENCKCDYSGTCECELFNHYMTSDPIQTKNYSDACATFPIHVDPGNADEISVEEVTCSVSTLAQSYEYFSKHVVRDRYSQTLISIARDAFKSVCFTMSCSIMEMYSSDVPKDSLCLPSQTHGTEMVVAHNELVLIPVLESICSIGVDPVVKSSNTYRFVHRGKKSSCVVEHLSPSGFTYSEQFGINITGNRSTLNMKNALPGSTRGLLAVGTASVTVSIVLTPRSYFGGRAPSTKTVSYHVHNIELM